MTKPVYKIEVRQPDETLRYTFTDNISNIYFKNEVTNGVGNFKFTLPTKYADSYKYYDTAVFDSVYIWLAYDSVPTDPLFYGKVMKIGAPLSTNSGYVREISGLGQGEILLRRKLAHKIWLGETAHNIVDALCSDLSLGTGTVGAEANTENIQVDLEWYFDVLRKVSDYWVSAGAQIKKDFYVTDESNSLDLVWADRPLRSAGVETLTVGKNIASYNVVQDVDSVRNKIRVYGRSGNVGTPGDLGRTYPTDGDTWTYDGKAAGQWVETTGTLASSATAKVGANSLSCDPLLIAGTYYGEFYRELFSYAELFGTGRYQTVNFWIRLDAAAVPEIMRLELPESLGGDYFYTDIDLTGTSGAWAWRSYSLGETEEYDADKNPGGVWHSSGTPNWDAITKIYFHYENSAANPKLYLDGLYFGHGRWRYLAEDSTSQTNYGLRDDTYIFDTLLSDADCESRAKALLYQLKDPPRQITVVTDGNANILAGDRLSMTIPAENISAVNFDVISVEHFLSSEGWTTKPLMMEGGNRRKAISASMVDLIIDVKRGLRDMRKP